MTLLVLLLSIACLALALHNRQLRRALEEETRYRREMGPYALRGRWGNRRKLTRKTEAPLAKGSD